MFYAVIGKMGITELLVILLIVLLVLGPTQLPKLSKVLGKTINSFKKGMDEELDSDEAEPPKAKKESEKEKNAE